MSEKAEINQLDSAIENLIDNTRESLIACLSMAVQLHTDQKMKPQFLADLKRELASRSEKVVQMVNRMSN